MPSVTGSINLVSGDVTLITAGTQETIQIYGLSVYCPPTDAILTFSFGSNAVYTCTGSGSGTKVDIFEPKANPREPLFQGIKGEDFIVNLSDAIVVYYNIQYTTI